MTAWFVFPQCGKRFGGLANMGSRKKTNMAVAGLARLGTGFWRDARNKERSSANRLLRGSVFVFDKLGEEYSMHAGKASPHPPG